MTHNFISEHWQEMTNGKFILNLISDKDFEEKPVIQMFMYLDDGQTVSTLFVPEILNFISVTNTIFIQSDRPFNGYLAIR